MSQSPVSTSFMASEAVGTPSGTKQRPTSSCPLSKVAIGNIEQPETPILSQREWQPFSLKLPFLLFFTLFQSAVLATVEIMYTYSIKHVGIAMATEHDSAIKIFSWDYLPIIIALFIALGWVSISLETARITPWQLLSLNEGASVTVLFQECLHNPFTAPLLSLYYLRKHQSTRAKLCHLAVFFSSLGHLVSFLVLPPLQSSLFSIQEVNFPIETTFNQMPPFNSSNPIVNTNRIGEIYLSSWLAYQGLQVAKSIWTSGPRGQRVAALPIKPKDQNVQHATFQASTTAYTSSLQCTTLEPTKFIYIDPVREFQFSHSSMMPNKTRINFSGLQYPISAIFSGLGDHSGCQFEVDVPLARGNDPTSSQIDEWYYGGMNFLSPTNSSSNSSIDTSCNKWIFLNVNYATIIYTPSNSSDFEFDVTFGTESTFNAVQCQSSYLEIPSLDANFLNANASLSFTNDSKYLTTKSTELPLETFNSTLFEEYLFVSFEAQKDNTSYPSTLSDGQPSTIQTNFQPLSYYFNNISPYNINLWRNMNLMDGLPEWAGEYFQAAFLQRIDLSSISWESKVIDTFVLPAYIPSQRHVVNGAYAKATEAILGLLILLALFVAILSRQKRTNLQEDPSSIAAKCLLVYRSPKLLSYIRSRGLFREPQQITQLCRLYISSDGLAKLEMEYNADEQRNKAHEPHQTPKNQTNFLTNRIYLQFFLIGFSMIVLATIISLWAIAQRHSGISPGSFYIHLDSVNQFAWTIVPVLAVILIKFFWGLVDDYFRLLQPYISLARTSAATKSSVTLNYKSTMEGWIIFKAAHRGHYLLAAITTISLATELLITSMGAMFVSRPVQIFQPLMAFTNSTLRSTTDTFNFTDSSQVYQFTAPNITIWDASSNDTNRFSPSVLSLSAAAWGGETAPWTSLEYSFLPVMLPGEVNGLSMYPENMNWTVSTKGVRGRASCQTLDTPPEFFQEVSVLNSLNITVAIGLEIHDWGDGFENTNNTVTFEQSIFRVPLSRTGVRARDVNRQGAIQSTMNYTAFWGPFWTANIDSVGNIELANITSPLLNTSTLNDPSSERTIWNLPESKAGYFGAGFVNFSRVQDPETLIWYSTSSAASFVACIPTFEYVTARLTLDGTSQRVLNYEIQGESMPINGSQYLETWHDINGNTPAQMGLGTAFTVASIFQTDQPSFELWAEPYFFTDLSSYIASFSFDDLSQMTEPGNLAAATEAAFTSMFSQYAAFPGVVFMSVDSPTPVTGELGITQKRILVSTTAMAIVVSILFIMIVVLATLSYYTKSFQKPLHQLWRDQDTIGAQLSWICNSRHLLRLVAETKGMKPTERARYLDDAGWCFRIGEFVGADRASYIGIEVNGGTEWRQEKAADPTSYPLMIF